jgi:hypothetical protein
LAATEDHLKANDGCCVFGVVHAEIEERVCFRPLLVSPPGPPHSEGWQQFSWLGSAPGCILSPQCEGITDYSIHGTPRGIESTPMDTKSVSCMDSCRAGMMKGLGPGSQDSTVATIGGRGKILPGSE